MKRQVIDLFFGVGGLTKGFFDSGFEIVLANEFGFYYKTTGIWHKTNPIPRNMNLHFVNSNECWIYFTYKTKTGTFNNKRN